MAGAVSLARTMTDPVAKQKVLDTVPDHSDGELLNVLHPWDCGHNPMHKSASTSLGRLQGRWPVFLEREKGSCGKYDQAVVRAF